MVCNSDKSVVYTLLGPASGTTDDNFNVVDSKLPCDGQAVVFKAIQGVAINYAINGETNITPDYLDDKKRAFIRLTSGSALPVSLDSHGRISIGKDVAEQFSLSSQVTIIGVLDHFEIWNPTLYSKYIASSSLAGFGKGL